MTEPVAPGTLSALTPQIPITSGDAAINTNRMIHFDETVVMVEQLNVELPKAHQNAVAAKEGADDAVTARNQAQAAQLAAETAQGDAEDAADRAESAASGVENPVSTLNKATPTDLDNGTADKWLDAAVAKEAFDGKAPAVHGHTIDQVDGLLTALDGKQPSGTYVTPDGTQTLTNKTHTNPKETVTNLGVTNSIDLRTIGSATVRPNGTISLLTNAASSNANNGQSVILTVRPSVNVTFTANASVVWPRGISPTLEANKTYEIAFINKLSPGTTNYFWRACVSEEYPS